MPSAKEGQLTHLSQHFVCLRRKTGFHFHFIPYFDVVHEPSLARISNW